ncbi:hypothetical protein D0Z08_00395 [Nocardioides immobilis]|uniref:Uncharacterized protein n=1 Tax=Nocardioides immobilis TaxID=2049295 RepID=A0A417Y8P6_9ACTN|nr:hypothetical protein D0Z08_00395 [Nocardioides immobilis]
MSAAVIVGACQVAIFLALPGIANRYDSAEVPIQDIWWPAVIAVWAEAVLIGLVMMFAERTRPVGVGLVLGSVATFALYYTWLVFVVSSSFA